MKNGDRTGLIVLSQPNTYYGLFFLLITTALHIGKKHEKCFHKILNLLKRYKVTSFQQLNYVMDRRGASAADVQLFVF